MNESEKSLDFEISTWTLIGSLAMATTFAFITSVFSFKMRRKLSGLFCALCFLTLTSRLIFHSLVSFSSSFSLMEAALVVPEALLLISSVVLLFYSIKRAKHDSEDEGELTLYYGRYRRGESIRRFRASLLSGTNDFYGATTSSSSSGSNSNIYQQQTTSSFWNNSSRVSKAVVSAIPFIIGAIFLVGQTVVTGLACASTSSATTLWRSIPPILRGCISWIMLSIGLIFAASHRFHAKSLILSSCFLLPKGILGALDWLYLWPSFVFHIELVSLIWLNWVFILTTELIPIIIALIVFFIKTKRIYNLKNGSTMPLLYSEVQ